MLFRLAADVTLLVHFAFILFVVGGALLVLRWPVLLWLHLPAAIWGAWIEISGGLCPLTTLENRFRLSAGQEGYEESFVEHYLMPVLYPTVLSRQVQIVLGVSVVVINLAIYSWILSRER